MELGTLVPFWSMSSVLFLNISYQKNYVSICQGTVKIITR